jgi:hypothetical protein
MRVKSMEEIMADTSSETHERVYADLHLPEARTAWKQAKEKAKHLEQELGIQDATVVKKLAHGNYYTARMNARVVKERLVSKLRARKFELDPIERSFRRTRSGKISFSASTRAESVVQKTSATSMSVRQSRGGSRISVNSSRRTINYARTLPPSFAPRRRQKEPWHRRPFQRKGYTSWTWTMPSGRM